MAPKSSMLQALTGKQAAPKSPAKIGFREEIEGYTGPQPVAKKPATKNKRVVDGTGNYEAGQMPRPKSDLPKPKEPVKPVAKKPAAPAKPKWDKELNSLVAERKGLKKGTAEYNRVQNRINEKMGSGVRRRTEETTKLPSKKPTTGAIAAAEVASSRGLTPKPAAKKPAAKKAPSQADNFEKALAKESAKAPMGSETRSKAPASKATAPKKPAAKKPAAKKPAAKKTVGQKVKATVGKARLAQLDRKADRQESRAERKTDRVQKRAAKLTGRLEKLKAKK